MPPKRALSASAGTPPSVIGTPKDRSLSKTARQAARAPRSLPEPFALPLLPLLLLLLLADAEVEAEEDFLPPPLFKGSDEEEDEDVKPEVGLADGACVCACGGSARKSSP